MAPPYPPTSTPLTPTTITSSLVPAIPVPTHGPGGTFTILSKTQILVPPELCLETIRNVIGWSRWNSFCPRGTIKGRDGGELSVGDEVEMDVYMDGNGLDAEVQAKGKKRAQGIKCTIVEPISEPERKGWRIAWTGEGYSHWQLHSERVMEFVEIEIEGKKGTEYVQWETFGGVLGSVVKRMVGSQLVDRFGDYSRDLKGFCEGKTGEEK